ncbi:MAG: glutaredoxin-related protein [Bacteroidales bacterium]|nr:glutaredoxin-related protein [Bacteroidales bacterium]
MGLTIIGSNLCGDTRKALKALDEVNASYEFLDISNSLDSLKVFLKERDTNPLYGKVKEKGTIGIPFFVLPDGTETFSLHKVLEVVREDESKI